MARPPTLLATPAQLADVAQRLGEELSLAHPSGFILITVLKGGVVLLADVARHVTVPMTIDFVAVAPYDGARGRTRLIKDVDADVTGRPVVLLTGIVDTGLTATYLTGQLLRRGAGSVALCCLADKRARRIVPTQVDFAGLEAPDQFLIGYGLDFAGRYRNLTSLYGVSSAQLAEDPDRFVEQLYGTEPPPPAR